MTSNLPVAAGRADELARGAVEGDVVLGVRRQRERLLQRHARRVGRDEEQPDALTGAGQHEQRVGRLGEHDVALAARQRPRRPRPGRLEADALLAEPAVGLEPRRRHDGLTRGQPGQPRVLLRVRAGSQQRRRRQHHRGEVRRRRQRTTELVVHDGRVEDRHLRPAVLLRQVQAQDPRLAQRGPELVGVPDRVVLELAHDLQPGVALAQAAHRVAQELLLFVEVEIHVGSSLRGSSARRAGPRGCRRVWSPRRCGRRRSCRPGRRRTAPRRRRPSRSRCRPSRRR